MDSKTKTVSGVGVSGVSGVSGVPGAPSGFRRGSLTVLRVAAGLTLLACVVQFVFAGLGAYGASFEAHRTLGGFIQLMTLVILVVGLLARPSRLTVSLSFLVALLAIAGQSVLANLGDEVNVWFGGLHALTGLAIMGLLERLSFGEKGFDAARVHGGT